MRKYGKEEAREILDEIEQSPVSGQDAEWENPVEQEVIADAAIEEALSGLKESERQIMNMKVLADMTFQEIAQSLQIPLGTVTWRYQSAVKS